MSEKTWEQDGVGTWTYTDDGVITKFKPNGYLNGNGFFPFKRKVKIPAKINKTTIKKIDRDAFLLCDRIHKAEFPEGIKEFSNELKLPFAKIIIADEKSQLKPVKKQLDFTVNHSKLREGKNKSIKIYKRSEGKKKLIEYLRLKYKNKNVNKYVKLLAFENSCGIWLYKIENQNEATIVAYEQPKNIDVIEIPEKILDTDSNNSYTVTKIKAKIGTKKATIRIPECVNDFTEAKLHATRIEINEPQFNSLKSKIGDCTVHFNDTNEDIILCDGKQVNKFDDKIYGIWHYIEDNNSISLIKFEPTEKALNKKHVEIPETIDNLPVTKITQLVFKNINLETINFSKNIREIWSAPESLRTVKIPGNVKTIEIQAFMNNKNLESVDIENGVKKIGSDAFRYCSSLSTLNLPDSIETIGKSAFGGCSSLKTVTVPKEVKAIEDSVFEGCTNLQTVNINGNVNKICSNAFNGCSELQTINIPDCVQYILSHAFERCSSLKVIDIPASVTTISDNTFLNCSGLQTVTIQKGTVKIWGSAFEGCTSLKEIFIPESIENCSPSAFEECSALKTINISGLNNLDVIKNILVSLKQNFPVTIILKREGVKDISVVINNEDEVNKLTKESFSVKNQPKEKWGIAGIILGVVLAGLSAAAFVFFSPFIAIASAVGAVTALVSGSVTVYKAKENSTLKMCDIDTNNVEHQSTEQREGQNITNELGQNQNKEWLTKTKNNATNKVNIINNPAPQFSASNQKGKSMGE